MRSAVFFTYLLSQIVYLIFTDGSRAWGGFNLISHMLFASFICYLAQGSKLVDKKERLLLHFMRYYLCANSAYTLVCIFTDSYWSIYQTDIFAYILGISFVVLMVHIGYNKDKFK